MKFLTNNEILKIAINTFDSHIGTFPCWHITFDTCGEISFNMHYFADSDDHYSELITGFNLSWLSFADGVIAVRFQRRGLLDFGKINYRLNQRIINNTHIGITDLKFNVD